MRSMTGYGAATVAVAGGRLVAEVKSVNARFLDLKIAVPREHQAIEAEVRDLVQASVERGRVDVSVRREGAVGKPPRLEVDLELARAALDAWRRVQRSLRLEGGVDLAFVRAIVPDAVRRVEAEVDPERERPALKRAVKQALVAHRREREREGAHLLADMRARLDALEGVRKECLRHAASMHGVLTQRLTDRVAALLGSAAPDPTRIVQEVVIAVERTDFSEELTRLASHLAAFRDLLRETTPIGKRVEFLLQEVLREVNTIGSKANHLPVTQAVLRAKSELEKLREQTANVE